MEVMKIFTVDRREKIQLYNKLRDKLHMIIPFGENIKKEYVPSQLSQNRKLKHRALSAKYDNLELNSVDKKNDYVLCTTPLSSLSEIQHNPHNIRKGLLKNENIVVSRRSSEMKICDQQVQSS